MKREVKKTIIESNCCVKKEIFLDLNFPLHINHLAYFKSLGLKEKTSYTTNGLFYVGQDDFIAIGPIGGNRLRIKCRNSNCLASVEKFELLIKEMPDESTKIPEEKKED